MPGDVTRDEFDHLRTRVDIVERKVEGEKFVTRHIFEQTRRNGADLAAMRSELNQKIDSVAQDLTELRGTVTGLAGTVHGLATNLPRIVGGAVREAMSRRGTKR
jgi:cell division protein FtsB